MSAEDFPAVLHRIVKANDVRGLIATELTTPVLVALGQAFAEYLVRIGDVTAEAATLGEASAADVASFKNQIILGHDMRESAEELVAAFAQGIRQAGVAAASVGLCSTDALYFASGQYNTPGVMFTASHNPAGWNGLKLCRSAARPVGLDSGLDHVRDRAIELLVGHEMSAVSPAQEPVQRSIVAEYAAYLRSLVPLDSRRPLRVVVDAGNGMAGLTCAAVFDQALGSHDIEIIELFFKLDGTFPNHEANPLVPENLLDLQAAVLEHQADLGLAFDGDADRCFVIDERGRSVSPSVMTALVAVREIAREVAEGKSAQQVSVIHNLITSRVVPETIAAQGSQAICTKVGHAFIKEVMAENDAVFGGEHSAHYYFRDFWFADTGMLAALHILAALSETEGPLSDLVAPYDRYSASGEINSTVTDVPAANARVIEAFSERSGSVEHQDGITISSPATSGEEMWWLNVRPSNTEPLLRLNVEAGTAALMEKIRDEALSLIRGS